MSRVTLIAGGCALTLLLSCESDKGSPPPIGAWECVGQAVSSQDAISSARWLCIKQDGFVWYGQTAASLSGAAPCTFGLPDSLSCRDGRVGTWVLHGDRLRLMLGADTADCMRSQTAPCAAVLTGATGGAGGTTGQGGAGGTAGRGGAGGSGTTGGAGGAPTTGGTGGTPTNDCSPSKPCPTGRCCQDGECVARCQTGCCDSARVCQPGTTTDKCGWSGDACENCKATLVGGICIPEDDMSGGQCGCTGPQDCSSTAGVMCVEEFGQKRCCAGSGARVSCGNFPEVCCSGICGTLNGVGSCE